MSADYGEASSLSAISSSLVTLFQFLPVPDVFSVFSMTGHDSTPKDSTIAKGWASPLHLVTGPAVLLRKFNPPH